MANQKSLKVTFLSTWPEIPDGIATFCENLALNLPGKREGYVIDWNVIKVNWHLKQEIVKHQEKVVFTLNYDHIQDYEKAADFVNNSDTDIVVIQFLNSIYGGNSGEYIFSFLERVKKPVLLILHSVAVLQSQKDVKLKRGILKRFAQLGVPVVVMSITARDFLIEKMNFSQDNVFHVYHGAPKFDKLTPALRNLSIRKSNNVSSFEYRFYFRGRDVLLR